MFDNVTRRWLLSRTGAGVLSLGVAGSADADGDDEKTKPEGADPASIDIDNGEFAVEVGETTADSWSFENSDTLFFEYFALQDGDGEVVPSYRESEVVETFPEDGAPGNAYTAVMRYDVGDTQVEVERTASLDPAVNQLTIRYEVTNVGDAAVGDLRLYEHCDYDVGGFYDDVGAYVDSPEAVYVTDGDGDTHVGFGGEAPSANHHVGEYPATDAVNSGSLNNDDRFPDSGTEDPVVAMEWGLGGLSTGDSPRTPGPPQSRTFTVRFGAANSRSALLDLVGSGSPVYEPSVVDFSRPPSAVTTDESAPFSLLFSPGSYDQADLEASLTVTETYRGDRVGSFSRSLSISEASYGRLAVSGELPPAADRTSTPEGHGYEATVDISADGQSLLSVDARTFAFLHVNPLLFLPVKGEGSTGMYATSDDLFDDVRESAERLNEYFASGLSTMGAHGMRLEFPTDSRQFPDGWLALSEPVSYFQNQADTRNAIRDDATQRATDELSIPTYEGRKPTVAFGFEDALAGGGEYYPNEEGPFYSRVVMPADGEHWLHELTHRQSFPDLYPRNSPPSADDSYVGDWGMMGAGDVLPLYCRLFWDWERWAYPAKYPNDYPTAEWLHPDRRTVNGDDTVEAELSAATGKELGDSATFFDLKLKESVIEEENGTIDILLKEFRRFVLPEARRAESSHVTNPGGGGMERSPDPNGDDGVALFSAGESDPTAHAPDDPVLRYLPPSYSEQDVTNNTPAEVSLDPDSTDNLYYDARSATWFEVTEEGFDGGTPTLRADRTADPAADDGGLVTVGVDARTDSGVQFHSHGSGAPPEHPIPRLDVVAETPDGRRVGTDPETGERVNEVAGARVAGPLGAPRVSVPLDEDVEVEVSDERYRSELQERGFEPPEAVEYRRETVVEVDSEMTTRDGVAYVDGRYRRVSTGSTDAQGGQSAFTSASATVDPERVNADARGEFVSVWIGFDDVDPSGLDPATVAVADVPAVADDQYGFVKDPPVEERDGETAVLVKVRRDALVDALGTGDHETAVTGRLGGTTFFGRAALTVFEAGNGNGRDSGNSGNGGASGSGDD